MKSKNPLQISRFFYFQPLSIKTMGQYIYAGLSDILLCSGMDAPEN